MFHEDILYISYHKYINFKCEFLNNKKNFVLQILSYPNKPYINGKLIY